MRNEITYASIIPDSSGRKWKKDALRYVRQLPKSERAFPTLSEIASAVGCTREFLRTEMFNDEEFRVKLRHRLGDNHGKIVDAAEKLIYNKIINNDLDAAKFALERLGSKQDDSWIKKGDKQLQPQVSVNIGLNDMSKHLVGLDNATLDEIAKLIDVTPNDNA